MDRTVTAQADQSTTRKDRRTSLRISIIYVVFATLWILVSDWILFTFVPNPAYQAVFSQLKGVGFVAVTGLFLYFLLRAEAIAGHAVVVDAADSRIDRQANPRLVLGAFIGLLATILAISYFVTTHINRLIREDEITVLKAVADLKVREIEKWLEERWADASVFSFDHGFGDRIHRWLDLDDDTYRERIAARLRVALTSIDYESILLYDARGRLRSEFGTSRGTNPNLDRLVKVAVKTGASQFSDLYRIADRSDQIYLDFVMPLIFDNQGRPSVAGVMVLRVDPTHYLYYLIQHWPLPSKSGETLIVRRDGDEVLYLNELRHRPDRALTLRMPVSSHDLLAAQAARGVTGTFEGRDYRGMPVFSVLQPIRGTAWHLIAKVDREEILAPTRQVQLVSSVITLGAIAFVGLVVGYGWRQQMRGFALRQRMQETEKQALIKHFEYLSRNANDLIVLADEELRIVDINERVFALIGYRPAEMIGQPLSHFRTAQEREKATQDYAPLQSEGHARYETTLNHRDGSEVPIEVSATRVEVEGRQYYQLVVRDITERKHAEEKLAAAAEQFQGLVEQSIAGIFIIVDERFAYANPRLGEILGYKSSELIGRDVIETVAERDHAAFLGSLARCLSGEEESQLLAYLGRRRDGSMVDVGAHINRAKHGRRTAVIGVVQDISDKKRAEVKIQEYIRQLERAMLGTIHAVSLMSELRDPYTYGHEQHVGSLAGAIGAEMGLDAETVKGLQIAGYVHDIGKIVVPAEILAKPTRLTDKEFELIKEHPRRGYEILKDIDFPWPVAQVALQHHERLDGSGYPQGLKGEQIIREARVLAVADVVEAMAAHRPYRPSRGIEEALNEIIRYRGVKYDAHVVDACVRLFRERGYTLKSVL